MVTKEIELECLSVLCHVHMFREISEKSYIKEIFYEKILMDRRV